MAALSSLFLSLLKLAKSLRSFDSYLFSITCGLIFLLFFYLLRPAAVLGPARAHWFRAKFLQRYRLFFRYDSAAKIIIFAWVNDEATQRAAGATSDPYAVFTRMLERGHPPDDWAALVTAARRADD